MAQQYRKYINKYKYVFDDYYNDGSDDLLITLHGTNLNINDVIDVVSCSKITQLWLMLYDKYTKKALFISEKYCIWKSFVS